MPLLTKREEDVLVLIGSGLRGRAIAFRLGIAEFTVRKHRANILRKLEFHSAAQLIAYAVRTAAGASTPPPLFERHTC